MVAPHGFEQLSSARLMELGIDLGPDTFIFIYICLWLYMYLYERERDACLYERDMSIYVHVWTCPYLDVYWVIWAQMIHIKISISRV